MEVPPPQLPPAPLSCGRSRTWQVRVAVVAAVVGDWRVAICARSLVGRDQRA